MDLALNNLQRLIYHATQTTNQPTNSSRRVTCLDPTGQNHRILYSGLGSSVSTCKLNYDFRTRGHTKKSEKK